MNKYNENFGKDFDKIKEFEKFGIRIGEPLGKGAFGLVTDVHYNDDTYAGKLVKKEGKGSECDLILLFKSPYIVKIIKIFNIDSGIYNFILMEKADLKDLSSFIENSRKNQIQNLIINPFYDGIVSDNCFKYFTKHLIIGLESLERIGYSHFDIKPGNILIFKNYILKLSDFSFLRNRNDIIKKNNMLQIPGGTNGYCPPEYYLNQDVTIENAKKHDYFSLGSTLFSLKYGKRLIAFPIIQKLYFQSIKDKEKEIIEYILEMLQRQINFIKSNTLSDKDFINFLCDLIQFNPEDRPKFEEIYRNKWLNKNSKEIEIIFNINNINKVDNTKLILELNKSDYLIDKKNNLNHNRKKFVFKKKK